MNLAHEAFKHFISCKIIDQNIH